MTEIKPYKNSTTGKKAQVKEMFDNISGSYDKINRLITFGMDIKWRNNVLNIVASENPVNILDIATGTGDMAILFSKTTAKKIVAIDISEEMLSVAKEKISNLNLKELIDIKQGDAENLIFDDNSFDVVTVSYGIRNFANLKKGLSEIRRVLKPSGVLVILETSVPLHFPFKQGYLIYTTKIMPFWGKILSKDQRAYSYLSDSALNFPYGEKLKDILDETGYGDIKIIPQSKGFSTIYTANKSSNHTL